MKEREGRQLTTWAAWGLDGRGRTEAAAAADRPTHVRGLSHSLTHSLTQGQTPGTIASASAVEGLLRLIVLLRGSRLLFLPGRASKNRLSMPTSLQLNQSLVLLLVTYVVFVRRGAVCLLPSPLLLFNCCLSSSSLLPPPITLVRPRPSLGRSVGRSVRPPSLCRPWRRAAAAAAQETYPKCCPPPPPPPPARSPHSAQPQ